MAGEGEASRDRVTHFDRTAERYELGAMMLDHLGEKTAANNVMAAIEATTARGIGAIPGKDKTEAITTAVLSALG